MSEQFRMLLILGMTILLMVISINLSTYSNQSKFLKEDIEVALHDASLMIDKEALSNGYIVFDKDAARATFEETLEINTGLTAEDYTVSAFEYFDHETHPEGFACESNTNPIHEFTFGEQSFSITCPTILAVISYKSGSYITLPGDPIADRDIVKGAAYSYELDSNIDVEVAGLTMAGFASLMSNNFESLMLPNKLTKQGDYYWPVPYTTNITSHFQKNRVHPITGELKDHNGVDIAASGVENEPALSIADGVVTYAGKAGSYGNVVEVTHDNNLVTRYAHLNHILVSKGQQVSGGDVVGLIGSTGNSTGPHLHFEALVNGQFKDPLLLFE